MDEGDRHLGDLAEAPNNDDMSDANLSDDEDDIRDVGDDELSTISVDEDEDDDIYGHSDDRPTGVESPEAANDTTNIGPPNEENENAAHESNSTANNDDEELPIDQLPIPRLKSIAYHYLQQEKVAIFSLDIEHGGEFCGLLQLSVEAFRIKLPYADNPDFTATREAQQFNEYIKPESEAIWNEAACQPHGLHRNHEKIVSGKDMATVWKEFVDYTNSIVKDGEVVILTAYNGETCDLKWLWKLTQAPNAPYTMPPQIKFFLDPLKVINYYTSCPLHKSKSRLESNELGCVWSYINEDRNLNGAHDSMVDAKAQTDIIIHEKFQEFIDKTNSIRTIEELFGKREQAEMRKKMEPYRNVHQPWKELKKDGEDFQWQPRQEDSYTGSSGGGMCGPSSGIKDKARAAKSLAELFLEIFPMEYMEEIADMTRKYAYQDSVVETEQLDADGKPKEKKVWKDCLPDADGATYRASKVKKRYDITPGYICSFIGILMIQGAHFGESKRSRKMWRTAPHGISLPYVSNTMPRDSYEFLRRYIHFCDNKVQRPSSGMVGHDPVYKVSGIMGKIMKLMQGAWIAGSRITIDESMIKYKGRAVCWIQYNPKKPIKHGIKVFVCCCAESAVMLSFEIYTGAETSTVDGTAVAVCDRLVNAAELTTNPLTLLPCKGRVLYTDNWYTSVKLAVHFWTKYKWTICGTMNLTDKKSRQDEDVPFLKLSKGALNTVERGWFREAVIKMTDGRKTYYIQCSTWRDKKQVTFLHTTAVGNSRGNSVRRHTKGRRGRIKIAAPQAQEEYADNYNAVDRNDRDSADWSTTIKTVRYFLRIFTWMLDRVDHLVYQIVVKMVEARLRNDWSKYSSKNHGREDFQIDLGISLIKYGIEYDLKNKDRLGYTGDYPNWMRLGALEPCDCGQCFFCVKGLTNGIAHKDTVKRKPAKKNRKEVVECSEERVVCTKEDGLPYKWNDYCRMCYRKQKNDVGADGKPLSKEAKLKGCRSSKMGCASCNEPICTACWQEGYDMHKKRNVE